MERFKNRYLEMWIEDEILYITYFPDVIVDLEAAQIILKDRLELINGMSYLTYIDVCKVQYWTSEARAFQATNHNNTGVKAFAVLINSQVQKTVINFYLYFNKPNTPTICFTKKEKAIKWLKDFK